MDLLFIIIASIALIPLVIFTAGLARIALGLLFVLFFPGYSFMAALFPRKTDLEIIMRLTFSLGASIAAAALLLLILNFTPWGLELYPIMVALLVFTGIAAGIAWLRRRKISPEERFDPTMNLSLAAIFRFWTDSRIPGKILVSVLALVIIGVIGALGFVLAEPKMVDEYTEFYLLDLDKKAEYYPGELAVGEASEVIIGITNREREPTVYNVEILLNGEKTGDIGPINLEQAETWEQEISFSPEREGPGQKVEFLLYKNSSQLYRTLHLRIDVDGEII